jgi:DNA-binding protein H-NS
MATVGQKLADHDEAIGSLAETTSALTVDLSDLTGVVRNNAQALNQQIDLLGEQAVKIDQEIQKRQEQGQSLETQIKGVQQDIGNMTAKEAFDQALVMRQKLLIDLTELKNKAQEELKKLVDTQNLYLSK